MCVMHWKSLNKTGKSNLIKKISTLLASKELNMIWWQSAIFPWWQKTSRWLQVSQQCLHWLRNGLVTNCDEEFYWRYRLGAAGMSAVRRGSGRGRTGGCCGSALRDSGLWSAAGILELQTNLREVWGCYQTAFIDIMLTNLPDPLWPFHVY